MFILNPFRELSFFHIIALGNSSIQSFFYKEFMDFYKPRKGVLKSIITKIIIKIRKLCENCTERIREVWHEGWRMCDV